MLTPLELDIMKAVWPDAPVTVRHVHSMLRSSRNLAYTTVMTVMDRLYRKGLLKRELKSRTHLYTPAIEYKQARDQALDHLVDAFFEGSRNKLLEFLNGTAEPGERQKSPQLVSAMDESLL